MEQNNLNKGKSEINQRQIESLKEQNEELKSLVNKLYKKQSKLETLIEKTGDAFIIGNKKGQIIQCNNKAVTLSAYSKDKLLLKKVKELLTNEHIPESFSRKKPDEPSNEFSSEQILIKKGGERLFVSTLTTLLPDGRYQIVLRNIDDRKKAELALFDSERQFRLLTENIHDVVWTTDKNLKTIYISSSIINLTGFSSEEYYQNPITEFITPISYHLIYDTFRKETEKLKNGFVIAKKYYISLEIKLLHKRNPNIWIKLKATILQNQFGEPVGFQGIMHSIEEKKQSFELFKRHKQKYDFALKSTRSGVWELDGNMLKISLDKNLFHLLGFKNNEFKPLLSDWVKTIYKDDRIFIVDILQDILDGKISQKTYECRRFHKEGYLIWFQEYAKAVTDKNGKVIEIIGTSKDISHQKHIEDKKFKYYAGLQLLIDSALEFLQLNSFQDISNYIGETLVKMIPDSVILIGSINEEEKTAIAENVYGANVSKLNNEFKQIGWNPFAEKMNISNHFLNIAKQKVLTDYKGGFEKFYEEISNKKINEKVKELFYFKNAYLIGIVAEDKVFGSIAILLKENAKIVSHDFVEAFIYLASVNLHKKYVENKLNQERKKLQNSEQELRDLNATKDKFFSIISHDLKNPFNTIIGFSGILLKNAETIDKEKIEEFSKLIYEAAESSYEMMLNLFQWAKSQRGKLEAKLEKLAINEIINNNIKLFASETVKKNIKISYEPKKELILHSDINMLDTIIRNLLSNALKFTAHEGKIKISTQENNGFVQISISDNGVGIKEEDKSKIFNLESSKKTYGTDMERGSGLGLILCQEFTKMLGGKIWFESKEGKGSTFSFTIPLEN
ncbi:MAG: hypothetical protein DRJ10_11770 [Bacteroidetes bacterium]|nr:MAG: hypothetical protein DRJ10_11770 [Bacteroidota bacterium]